MDVLDVFVVDPDAFEDGLVDQPPLLVVRQHVGVLDVVHQVERDVQVLKRFLVRLLQYFRQRLRGCSFAGDPVGFLGEELVADAVGVVGVEQLAFFRFEPGRGGLGFFEFVSGGRFDMLDVAEDLVADALLALVGQGDLGVVLGDPGLHRFDAVVGLRAGLLLATSADEVVVVGAATSHAGEEQPAVAASAVDGAAQVVVVPPGPLAAYALGVEQVLHPLEGDEVDQRFVASGVLLAVVFDDAGVVPVAQQALQPVRLDRLGL